MDQLISVLVPSRGRPDQLEVMCASALITATGPVELVVRLDDDDPADYRPVLVEVDVVLVQGPRTLLSSCWNECFDASSGSILMHCGDDIRFRTPGWDAMVRDAFARHPDGIAFVHGRDGFQDERLGTHGFLSRRWVETVGYFVPPLYSSDFNDLHLTEVADAIGRRVYLPGLLTEHMHPAAGKGEWDLTHRERLARHASDKPEKTYARHASGRATDARKLRNAIRAFRG